MPTPAPTGILTLMFTDIQGSTELWERLGDTFRPVLDRHNLLIHEAIEGWDGYEVKSQGDSFMVAFSRATDAVQCCLEIQRSLAAEPWPAEVGEIRVRIGLHTGEPFLGYDAGGRPDYFGPAVNRAARMAAAGHGGQILVSSATRDVGLGAVPADVEWLDLGSHRLRGLEEPQRLFEVRHPDLPRRSFPPLKTLDTTRSNLPEPPTPFIGRTRELAELRQLLLQSGTRLLTLVGFGGIGKTRVALELGEMCAGEFPDGVWWVEAVETTAGADLVERIARQLRFPLQPQPSVREQLLGFLRDRHLLLILDNTEQIPDAGIVVKELLAAAPRLKCLTTARRSLDLAAERLVEIRPLPPGEAEALFVERARARQAEFALTAENRLDVVTLCRQLEGVPLAVELAASRIVGLTPRQILQRLSERFRLLQSRSPDLPPRQRALRAAIDWSYSLLSEEDRSLFAQLSVFAGGFTLEDAEQVCEAFDVFESVLELRRHSLFQAEVDPATQEARYVMLEALREYAGEKLREEGAEPRTRRRHADRFLRLGQDSLRALRTPREAQAVHRLEVGADNLRAAVEWAGGAGETRLHAELALVLGVFLQRQGLLRESVEVIETGLAAAGCLRASRPELIARLLQQRAGLHFDLGEPALTRVKAQEALSLFEELADAGAQAAVENLLGSAAMDERAYDEARRYFFRALRCYEAAGEPVRAAIALNNIGVLERRAGDLAKARSHLEAALQARRAHGDGRGTAETLNNLGFVAWDEADWDTAWSFYREALEHEVELDHPSGVAVALSNLGEVTERQGHLDAALRLFVAAERLMEEMKSPHLTFVAGLLAEVVERCGCTPAALERLRRAAEARGVPALIAWALERQADA